MISEELVVRIRRLFYGEHWKVGTIVEQLGVHPDTVRRVIDTDRLVSRGVVRPSALDPYVDFIRATLEQYPRLTGTRLHEMLRLRGYAGSVVQLRRRIEQLGLRPARRPEAFFRLSTLPGEQAQVDWAHLGTLRVGQDERPVFALVMVLSWSRAVHVYFSFEQLMSAVLRGHVESFETFKGVPRQILYDNMKTVVVERVGDAIRFHPRFLELSSHYLFQGLPCRPARGNEKGRVERKIRYLRTSFLNGRHFSDLADFRRQFHEWRDQVAHRRPCPADPRITVAEALSREQKALLPMPTRALDTDQVEAVLARKQPYVRLDTNSYSIPHDLVGKPLTLVASDCLVRILDGDQEVARHERRWNRHQIVEDPAHLEGLLTAKQKARSFKGRDRLLAEVPGAARLLDILARHNEPLGSQTAKLLQLLDLYGADLLTDAIDTAIARETPRADSIAYLLERSINPRDASPRPLSRLSRPQVDELRVRNHRLEDYDDLADARSDE